MLVRKLGRTGYDVSVLSYGCGAVGGLMTKGDPADQERAVAFAIERGITYFDTAPQYGNGTSEVNLGRILAKLKPNVRVGTKVRLKPEDYARIGAAIPAALDASLKRLGLDSVDLYQMHNRVTAETDGDALRADAYLGDVAETMEKLKSAGKIRAYGITAIGETPSLLRVIGSGKYDTAQMSFNALNPSAASTVPDGYPGQDYGQMMAKAHAAGVGTIGIRMLAAGALSGSEERHPLAMPSVDPIGSGSTYGADVERANRFAPLIHEGYADTLPELSVRYAISFEALSTALVGIANFEQLEVAVKAAEKGPLPAAALARMKAIQSGFAGESR